MFKKNINIIINDIETLFWTFDYTLNLIISITAENFIFPVNFFSFILFYSV